MGGKLELRAISKDFHGFAIKHLSLTVEPGEYLVVVGPTGAGKTLLLETIQGFHPLRWRPSTSFNHPRVTRRTP